MDQENNRMNEPHKIAREKKVDTEKGREITEKRAGNM